MSPNQPTQPTVGAVAPLGVEFNGINVIDESERKGAPHDLFWPWAAANISVLGIGYGAYVLAFGVNFTQAVIAGLVGIVVSFLLCGFVALAGKRGSAPTMILSRAAFGVHGNRVPSAVSWLLRVGWETVLAGLAALASATVIHRLAGGGDSAAKIIGFVVVVLLVIAAGVLGFDTIMRLQTWITYATVVLTVGYILLTLSHVHWAAVSAMPAGSVQEWVGALVFVMTGFGLGWVNSAADYSRYLPRSASSRGVVGWTTFGSSVAPVVLLLFGLLLAGSSKPLREALNSDPIGALTEVLPTWYLVPFIIVAVLGLVGGAVLDIYSSGLALLSVGVRVPRPVAAGIDGVIMTAGAIYLVFVANNFLFPFMGFLITLGVPIAAWAGIMLADLALRHRDYAEPDLFVASGRYGAVRWGSVALLLFGSVVGWGLVVNTYAGWLGWQGYLLDPLGLGHKVDGQWQGAWTGANLGVLFALVIGFVGWLVFGRASAAAQESRPVVPDQPEPLPAQ